LIETALQTFDGFLNSLTSISEDYKQQIDAIIQKARDSLHRLLVASDSATATHQAYVDAGKAVEAAYAANSPTYPELLRRFVQLQDAAVTAHRENNSVRGTVTTSFAEYLSDFERIEEGRSARVGRSVKELGEGLTATVEKFGQAATAIRGELEFSDDSECKLFGDTSFVKDAAASVRYQAVPVPVDVCQTIDMKKFYHAELKAGGKLYQAKSDFHGGVEYLDVLNLEILCAIEDGPEVKKCKNINECIGLVPSSVLKPL
jgi:hypothetical protein